ncbi:MAG TPA: hypothetical protein VFK94_05440 [Patescibacteria group bacterium]|nr:hypothetical protein [Patescibacteria group bacterium]
MKKYLAILSALLLTLSLSSVAAAGWEFFDPPPDTCQGDPWCERVPVESE